MNMEERIPKSRPNILKKLQVMLEPHLRAGGGSMQLEEQTNLFVDIRLDSVAILRLILAIEKEFLITINDYEIDAAIFEKTGNLLDIIEKKINENN